MCLLRTHGGEGQDNWHLSGEGCAVMLSMLQTWPLIPFACAAVDKGRSTHENEKKGGQGKGKLKASSRLHL